MASRRARTVFTSAALAAVVGGCAAQAPQRAATVVVTETPVATAPAPAPAVSVVASNDGSPHNFVVAGATPGPAPARTVTVGAPASTTIYAPTSPTAATTATGTIAASPSRFVTSSTPDVLDPRAQYQVVSSTTVNITSPLHTTEERSTTSEVTVTATPDSRVTLDILSTNGDRCVLHAQLTAPREIAFVPGQHCTVNDEVHNITLHVTTVEGTGTITHDALALQIHWTVAGQVFFASIGGTATQTAQGRRL